MKVLLTATAFLATSAYAIQPAVPQTKPVTPLAKKVEDRSKVQNTDFGVQLYKPTYVLFYNYTAKPYQSVYNGHTPDNQKIMSQEMKVQMSFQTAAIKHLFWQKNLSLDLSYTQLMFWQFYNKSQFFRETNYEPQVFAEWFLPPHWLVASGMDHDSNGKGGEMERSWNRVFVNVQYSLKHFLVGLEAWSLVFKSQSSDLHNPLIGRYLGHESLLFAVKFPWATWSIQGQNFERGMKYFTVESSLSFPLTNHFQLYFQYFNGYGQSLIEYNHYTQSYGVGVALNNWL